MLYDDNGAVRGVATGDMGVAQGRRRQGRTSRAAWSCAANTRCSPKARAARSPKQLIARFGSGDGREPQKFGIGLKELWQVAPEKHHSRASCSTRSAGRSTTAPAAARSSITTSDNLVSVGFVVHLNYENPYLSPFDEFQRFKTHPAIRDTSRAASASAMARAPSPRAAGSRCRSWPFPAAR